MPPSLRDRIDSALERGSRYLLVSQSPDGAWRSPVYGQFKEGDALTPLVVASLLELPRRPDLDTAIDRGSSWLADLAHADGRERPLTYPVYTSALSVTVLSDRRNERHRKARDAWLVYLRERQLTESLGWQATDPEYGGWGYSAFLPRKPAPGQPVDAQARSNLSATVYALEALRAAGCTDDDPAVLKAKVFVERCQNFGEWGSDGGFFFVDDDSDRNKAGPNAHAGKGTLYHSYGSTTADGLRALRACSPSGGKREEAARAWLVQRFAADRVPGTFLVSHEPRRQATYYYYCASVARALRQRNVPEERWNETLAEHLLSVQRQDGSWVNPLDAVREDEPIIATSFALRALATCIP